MRWITNILSPNHRDFRMYYGSIRLGEQTANEAVEQMLDWLKSEPKKIRGLPKATDSYTSEELRQMGMEGVYVEDESEERKENHEEVSEADAPR